jgi:hypothetical protein
MSGATLSQTKEGYILQNSKEELLISLTKRKDAKTEKAEKQLLED